MSQTATLYGVSYQVPEVRDTGWGPTVTSILMQLIAGLDGLSALAGVIPILRLRRSDQQSLAAGTTLGIASSWQRIQGASGAVTLSATVPITPGQVGGQILLLMGTSATSTVRINHGGNVYLNGDVILGLNEAILLIWDDQQQKWLEVARNG